jgi:hypothetical protein
LQRDEKVLDAHVSLKGWTSWRLDLISCGT